MTKNDKKFLINLATAGLENQTYYAGSELANLANRMTENTYQNQPNPRLLLALSGELETLAKARLKLDKIRAEK